MQTTRAEWGQEAEPAGLRAVDPTRPGHVSDETEDTLPLTLDGNPPWKELDLTARLR